MKYEIIHVRNGYFCKSWDSTTSEPYMKTERNLQMFIGGIIEDIFEEIRKDFDG